MHVGRLDLFALAVLVRDAAADRLIAQAEIAVEAVGNADPVLLEAHRIVADDRVLDVLDDLAPRHRLEVMGVDVADQPVGEAALARVLAGVREDVARIGEDVDGLHRQRLAGAYGRNGDVHGFLACSRSAWLSL